MNSPCRRGSNMRVRLCMLAAALVCLPASVSRGERLQGARLVILAKTIRAPCSSLNLLGAMRICDAAGGVGNGDRSWEHSCIMLRGGGPRVEGTALKRRGGSSTSGLGKKQKLEFGNCQSSTPGEATSSGTWELGKMQPLEPFLERRGRSAVESRSEAQLGFASAWAEGFANAVRVGAAKDAREHLSDTSGPLAALLGWSARNNVLIPDVKAAIAVTVQDLDRLWLHAVQAMLRCFNRLRSKSSDATNRPSAAEEMKEVTKNLYHYFHLMTNPTRQLPLSGTFGSSSTLDSICPHLPSWDFLSIPTADAKTILFIHRGTLFDEIDEVTKLSPGEAAASIQSFSMKHTPRCSAESDWEDLQQVAFQISAGVGEGGAAAVTQIVEQLTGTISRNIAAGAAVGAEAKSTSSARGVAGDPRVASGGVAGLFGPSPHRRLSGNFGSLPALDRQIVVDGANVAWGFDKKQFRVEALEKCLDWFSTQGYAKVLAFVPYLYSVPVTKDRRKGKSGSTLRQRNVADEPERLKALFARGLVQFTPSGADDDAFIIQFAFNSDGFIVSNDNYREFKASAQEDWQAAWLVERHIFYTFVAGVFIPTAPKVLRKPLLGQVPDEAAQGVDPSAAAGGGLKGAVAHVELGGVDGGSYCPSWEELEAQGTEAVQQAYSMVRAASRAEPPARAPGPMQCAHARRAWQRLEGLAACENDVDEYQLEEDWGMCFGGAGAMTTQAADMLRELMGRHEQLAEQMAQQNMLIVSLQTELAALKGGLAQAQTGPTEALASDGAAGGQEGKMGT